MTSTETRLIAGLLAALSLGVTSRADAEDEYALTVDGLFTLPIGEPSVGASHGANVEFTFFESPGSGSLLVSGGAFAAFGLGLIDSRPVHRDLYDLHTSFGLRIAMDDLFAPFFAIGLDVLSITTWAEDQVFRGTTFGAHARIGMDVHFAEGWVIRFGAVYLGAIVPGTGDALGTLVFTLGLGATDAASEPEPPPPPPPPPHDDPMPPRSGGVLPPDVAASAATVLECRVDAVGGSHLEDVRLGCVDPASCAEAPLLFRRYQVGGCGRSALLRCYETQAGGTQQCVREAEGAQ